MLSQKSHPVTTGPLHKLLLFLQASPPDPFILLTHLLTSPRSSKLPLPHRHLSRPLGTTTQALASFWCSLTMACVLSAWSLARTHHGILNHRIQIHLHKVGAREPSLNHLIPKITLHLQVYLWFRVFAFVRRLAHHSSQVMVRGEHRRDDLFLPPCGAQSLVVRALLTGPLSWILNHLSFKRMKNKQINVTSLRSTLRSRMLGRPRVHRS